MRAMEAHWAKTVVLPPRKTDEDSMGQGRHSTSTVHQYRPFQFKDTKHSRSAVCPPGGKAIERFAMFQRLEEGLNPFPVLLFIQGSACLEVTSNILNSLYSTCKFLISFNLKVLRFCNVFQTHWRFFYLLRCDFKVLLSFFPPLQLWFVKATDLQQKPVPPLKQPKALSGKRDFILCHSRL